MDRNDSVPDIRFRRRWAILGVAYLSNLAYAITLQAVPPVLSLIMADLNLSHTEGGLLMSLFALPGVFFSIPAGMLADRYGQKTIGIISFILTIGGIAIVASGSSLPILVLGRIISGVGAIILLVLSAQILAQWFRGREIGVAVGAYQSAMPVGTILSLSLLSILGANMGWKASVWVSAAIPLAGLVMFALLFAAAPRTSKTTLPRGESFLRSIRLTGTPIWIIGAAHLLFNAAALSFYTFTPDLLQGKGFTIAEAGFFTSAAMWACVVLCPVMGYVMDKTGHKRAIIAIGGLGMAILLALVPSATSWMLVLMLTFGVAQIMVAVPLFALPPEVASPERLGLSYGIFTSFLMLGVLVGPAVTGLVRDITGVYQSSYTLMAGFAFLIIITMFLLNWRQKRILVTARSTLPQ